MNFIRIFTISCVGFLMSFGICSASQTPDEIAAHIFLGQAYPSGNIYLKTFPLPDEAQSELDYLKSFQWPEIVKFQALMSTHTFANTMRIGKFSSVMHDSEHEIGPNVMVIDTGYIPSMESMDDSHEGCTKEFYKPKNKNFQYLGVDFYDQVLFNCSSNEGTAIYKNNMGGNYSFAVLAFDKAVELIEIQLINGKSRPLTAEESEKVTKEKLDASKNESECTTIPAYLDQAAFHLLAKVKGSDSSIRISHYETPGCAGHLANVYILDILKKGVLLKKYELIQYEGAI